MSRLTKGQIVRIIRQEDAFYRYIGKIVDIKDDAVVVDVGYITRKYRFKDVLPIVEGQLI